MKKTLHILLNILLIIYFITTLIKGSMSLFAGLSAIVMWFVCYNLFYWTSNKQIKNS